jgi:hypothetical protein
VGIDERDGVTCWMSERLRSFGRYPARCRTVGIVERFSAAIEIVVGTVGCSGLEPTLKVSDYFTKGWCVCLGQTASWLTH